MKKISGLKFETKCFLLSIPAFAGLLICSIFPFFRSIYYSLIENVFTKEFVFLDNYIDAFGNQYFRLALKNTFIFSSIGVVLLMVLSFAIALMLTKPIGKLGILKSVFTLPMLLPTTSIIFVWQIIFSADFFQNNIPIMILYLWKNAGINIILFLAAFSSIAPEITQAARLDGCNSWKLQTKITLPLILPTTFFVFILSLVNTLKVFKESYLFFGSNYPPDAVYSMQYYMNNHFFKLNYQNLSTASVVFALAVSIIIFVFYKIENNFSRKVF